MLKKLFVVKYFLLCSVLVLSQLHVAQAQENKGHDHDHEDTSMHWKEALKKLKDGNKRFVKDRQNTGINNNEKRKQLVDGQKPYATILSCSDSRVPPETVFDAGLGEVFVIRVAGNVLDEAVQSTLEYSVGVLEVPLVLVMGHASCGAVSAAISGEDNVPGYLKPLVQRIAPALKGIKPPAENKKSKEKHVANSVKENAIYQAKKLVEDSKVVQKAKKDKPDSFKVISAYYDLATGKVKYH